MKKYIYIFLHERPNSNLHAEHWKYQTIRGDRGNLRAMLAHSFFFFNIIRVETYGLKPKYKTSLDLKKMSKNPTQEQVQAHKP